jgi:redox-sensitive bicupin YhaK (pirin superfamily)
MTTTLYNSADRGKGDYGWLKPNYYFSFGQYHNPKNVHFGALRVLNDDYIAGGGAFPTHPHDNMEIITIPFTGALKHKDSTGGSGIIKAGDVQIMSAGTGVQHSEANASATDPVTLFQIWIFPKVNDIQPRYDQRTFKLDARINTWQYIISGDKKDETLWINQDARFALTSLKAGNTLVYTNKYSGNGIFLVNIHGKVSVGENVLNKRDALAINGTDSFNVTAEEDAELLAIEIPVN